MKLPKIESEGSKQIVSLLTYLKEHKVQSISDLARKLGRKFEAVHRDIRYLDRFVKLKREEANKVPYVDEGINIEMIPA